MLGQLSLAGRSGRGRILRPQDVFQILTQPANQMQAAINALPFAPGLLIDKDRVAAGDWSWRSAGRNSLASTLASNTTAAETTWGGYTGTNNRIVYALKQQRGVYWEVLYTGDGTSGRVIPHGLGIKPGMIIVKRRNTADSWYAYSQSIGAAQFLLLDQTSAAGTSAAVWANTEPTATGFSVGSGAAVNANGSTYVAYLFAHDPDTTNGIVQCGSFTTDANGAASVTLGWQPQWILLKASSTSSGWFIFDTVRGINAGSDPYLRPDQSNAEATQDALVPNNNGITLNGNVLVAGSASYVFCAIRAPIT